MYASTYPVGGRLCVLTDHSGKRDLFPWKGRNVSVVHDGQDLSHPVKPEPPGNFAFELVWLRTAGQIG